MTKKNLMKNLFWLSSKKEVFSGSKVSSRSRSLLITWHLLPQSRVMHSSVQITLSFLMHCGMPDHGTVTLTFWVSHSTSINLI